MAMTLIDMTSTVHSVIMGKVEAALLAQRPLLKIGSAPNMFSVADKGSHTARKRAFASVYSKTNLQASAQWETMARVILMERLLPALEAAAKDNNPVEILELGLAISMDFVTSYLFGLGNDSNFLQDLNARMQWLNAYHGSKRMSFLSMEFPTLNGLLSKISSTFISGDASAAANDMKMICLEKMEVIEKSSSRTVLSSKSIPKGSTSTRPVVYDQLNSPFSSQSSSNPPLSSSTPTRLDVASELMDHVMAGSETTTWTLTYVFHELSQQPKLQLSLRSELLTLSPSLVYPNKSRLPIPRAIDALPLLDAVILETLRLHPSVPGSQLRITPSASSTVALSTYNYIPANITVSAQAYSLHRNASVFPEPETWRPERWLVDKEQRDEMMRWFWAFGSGARGCIGKDFAMQEMKLVIAAIYTSYVTSVVDDEGIEQGDGYSTGPKRNRLVLHFERASET